MATTKFKMPGQHAVGAFKPIVMAHPNLAMARLLGLAWQKGKWSYDPNWKPGVAGGPMFVRFGEGNKSWSWRGLSYNNDIQVNSNQIGTFDGAADVGDYKGEFSYILAQDFTHNPFGSDFYSRYADVGYYYNIAYPGTPVLDYAIAVDLLQNGGFTITIIFDIHTGGASDPSGAGTASFIIGATNQSADPQWAANFVPAETGGGMFSAGDIDIPLDDLPHGSDIKIGLTITNGLVAIGTSLSPTVSANYEGNVPVDFDTIYFRPPGADIVDDTLVGGYLRGLTIYRAMGNERLDALMQG